MIGLDRYGGWDTDTYTLINRARGEKEEYTWYRTLFHMLVTIACFAISIHHIEI